MGVGRVGLVRSVVIGLGGVVELARFALATAGANAYVRWRKETVYGPRGKGGVRDLVEFGRWAFRMRLMRG